MVSFNCRSVKRCVNHITDLCEVHDIIALQEHWLLPDDLGYLDKIHPDFSSYGVSAVDTTTGVLKGRPYGGVAILWKRSVFPNVRPIDTGSTRVAAVCIQLTAGRSFIVMSVYMPTEDADNLPLFTECMGVISAVIETNDVETVLVLGDFNADVSRSSSLFGGKLLDFCNDQSWVCADLALLGTSSNSFTYLSDAHGTTSWLDHCIATEAGLNIVDSIYISNDVYYSDHFPLIINCNIDMLIPKIDKAHSHSINRVIWGTRNKEQKCNYANLCFEYLDLYEWPTITCKVASCNDCHHHSLIDTYYKQIINSITKAAKDSCQGKIRNNKKPVIGWNHHVKECHAVARQYYQLWNFYGRPTQGNVYNNMIHSKKIFKNKIRWCQLNETKIKMDIIATYRNSKDFGNFWKETNKLNYKSNRPLSVEGNQDPSSIANLFVDKFNPPLQSQSTCTSSNSQSVGASRGAHGGPETADECSAALRVTAEDVYRCVTRMKRGKSPGHDGLSVEHLLFAPKLLFEKLAIFFNLCIEHSYLPADFMRTIVVPIIKNRTGDVSSSSNYRPISLATIFSKVFETIIMKHLNENNIPLNNAQFGFRRGSSTDLAIFALKNTVYEYLNRNTTVYSCFLDLSRAFDTINYNILWEKLRKTEVPPKIVNILEYWYANQVNQVKWNNTLSETYRLTSGVRQGGLTSPVLFNLYINELIEELSSTRVGCQVGGVRVNNLSYADDMVLLSPSVNGIRQLINICEKYATRHHLTYNVKKTEVMIFKHKKGPDVILPISLCGTVLKIVTKFKYLGHIVTENLSDDDDMERQRRSIACRSNMLARRFYHCSKQVKVTLFKAYCQSFYTSQLWYRYTRSAYNTLRVQYNNAFRVMMNLPWRCSATDMFAESRVAGFAALLQKLRVSFYSRVALSKNRIVSSVFHVVHLKREMKDL